MKMSKQERIMIWTTPRSIATTFCRSIYNSGYRTKMFFEPFFSSYFVGPEKKSQRCDLRTIKLQTTFESAKTNLEKPHPDFDLVLGKVMAFTLSERTLKEWLVKDYQHTFFIRRPQSAITSLYNLLESGKVKDLHGFDAAEASYKELALMASLLKRINTKFTIIDADDLLQNPTGMMRAYCQKVGIVYSDFMLNWQSLEDQHDKNCARYYTDFFGTWPREWFTSHLSSTTFIYPNRIGSRYALDKAAEFSNSNQLIEAIEVAKPYYSELYNMRLVP